VERLGDELLAGPGLALNQDGDVGVGDAVEELEDLLDRLRLADDLVVVV
jgi:hypothetical protein